MAEPKEPQSYGSEQGWVKGDVAQEVNRQKGHPSSQHADFYESRRDKESSGPEQGGKVSPVQASENTQPAGPAGEPESPTKGVTSQKNGAKTGGFFKKRDS